jgi:hypothetical protein
MGICPDKRKGLSASRWYGAVSHHCLEKIIYNIYNLSDVKLHYVQGLISVQAF